MFELGALQSQVDLQGVFINTGDFVMFKELRIGIPREQGRT